MAIVELSLLEMLLPGAGVAVGAALLWRHRTRGRRLEPVVTADVAGLGLEHLVLQGQGPEAVLDAACAALAPRGGVAEVWMGDVAGGGLRPVASTGSVAGGQRLAEQAAGRRRVITDGADVAIPLLAAGEVAAVIVVQTILSDDVRRVERAAPHIAAMVRWADDQRRSRLLSAAVASTATAVFVTDRDGRIQWANEGFTRSSGYSLAEVLGRTPAILHSGVQPQAFYAEMWQRIARGEVWRGELVEQHKDGTFYTVEQTVTPMCGTDGAISHFVVVHEDITARKHAEERVRYLSSYDTLTGLPNRTLFIERLQHAVDETRIDGGRLAVLFLDLEHFSRINDAMGHEFGDRLLTAIVGRISAAVPSMHTIARVGGDEFAFISSDSVDSESAAALARRLIAEVVRPFDIEGRQLQVGASVGITFCPDDGYDPAELVKNADMAMYQAMKEAPNGYSFFSPEIDIEISRRRELERDLRLALGKGEFRVHYQPQLCVHSGRIVALEALLRWYHPRLGQIPPARFVPIAEETGQIVPIGEWVLDQVVAQLRRWREARVPVVPVSVNLSAAQLRQPDLALRVDAILERAGITASLLELELTETMIMDDRNAAIMALSELYDRGIRLAIDDFGTGYSSLNYLKRFPVHKLKIDKSFVRELGRNPHDAQIARAIIALGHSLGLEVVSEGVEDERQLNYLRSAGCDIVQGFLYSAAVPAEGAAALLTAQPFATAELSSSDLPQGQGDLDDIPFARAALEAKALD